MNKKFNKFKLINVFLYLLWISIAIILINLPTIMGDKFSLELGRTFVFIYILSIFIVTYVVNRFIK